MKASELVVIRKADFDRLINLKNEIVKNRNLLPIIPIKAKPLTEFLKDAYKRGCYDWSEMVESEDMQMRRDNYIRDKDFTL